LSVNTEIVGLAKDLFQVFLVLSFSSESVWFCDGAGEVCRINQSLFVVNNVNFPQRSIPLIGIFFTVAIDYFSPVVHCVESKFVKFHFNLGLRQEKSG